MENPAFKTKLIPALIIFLTFSCTDGLSPENMKPSPAVDGAAAYVMLDLDKVNDPAKEWCYTPKSTTVIGMPFTPRPVQITYDGALYTRDAEVCFFYSDSLKPLMARQKTFLEGWIPVVQYEWKENGISYTVEMFGTGMEEVNQLNTLLFVRLSARNDAGEPRRAVLASASRFSGKDHRFGKSSHPCTPDTRYEMKNGMFLRDGKLVYAYPVSSELYSVPGVQYVKPFKASDLSVTDYTSTGISKSTRMLGPGETFDVVFRMPNFPVNLSSAREISFINNAAYDEYRKKTIDYWRNRIEGVSSFKIPEPRVNDSYKAGLVHLLLATRTNAEGVRRQGSGLPYDDLFFNDYVDMRRIYDLAGLSDMVGINVKWLMDYQNSEGMFLDPILTHGQPIMASHGQALVSLANHYVISGDKDYARMVYPTIKKAVEWMHRSHLENQYGLMPASIPFDAEMIKGHYTSHNLWCLLGLRDAIRVAKGMGEENDVREWTEFHELYRNALLRAIAYSADSVKGRGGYVPTGLYEFITGPAAREGFPEYSTNQDWENNLLIYPTEVLGQYDHRIPATLDTIRRKKYREGIMTYRNGMHLHQYATVNQAHQYLAINDQESALRDLYHILLHNGSTHEGFENMIEPWEDMDPWPIPAPHAWAAAKTSLLIRNMLVREYGGEAGLHENQRSLYLFSVISPEWALSGEPVIINNAVTEMGKISAEMNFTEDGASVKISPSFHTQPASIWIALPWYVKLKGFKSNASSAEERNGYLVFSPDVTEVDIKWAINRKSFTNTFQDLLIACRQENSIKWRDVPDVTIIPGNCGFLLEDELQHPDAPLSFDLVKRAFIKEYNRRLSEYLAAGKKPMEILPPPMILPDSN